MNQADISMFLNGFIGTGDSRGSGVERTVNPAADFSAKLFRERLHDIRDGTAPKRFGGSAVIGQEQLIEACKRVGRWILNVLLQP